ncbi:MAG: hypothetical protein OFPI_20000 [Osedax symbiont Rs2]|nr:MAG: hypothetical protein OFPI_20000 [Osedax symbiont Rs2]
MECVFFIVLALMKIAGDYREYKCQQFVATVQLFVKTAQLY